MSLTRRELLRRAGTAGAASMIPVLSGLTLGCSSDDDKDGDDGNAGPTGPENLFEHGVASGDPLTDAVILWTALSPEDGTTDPIEVTLEVATDAEMSDVVSSGAFETNADRGWTIKVDVADLDAGTTYYYRFSAQNRESVVGRTRTAPSGAVDHLRLAVCSCSNFNFGYFHGYRQIAGRADLDAVFHLGDYIYEYGPKEYGLFRAADPQHEIITLEDYRTRYSAYRLEAELQDAHRQHPFITIWDDHESANDSYKDGAENHTEGEEGTWTDRLTVAKQAYDEWMPYREGVPGEIYRSLSFGDLVDVVMLDTRIHGRDLQVDPASSGVDDPTRQLLGADQEQWLFDQLSAASAKWKIVGQQVVMTQVTFGGNPINGDQWDGYAPARDRVLGHIEDNGIDNVVVITGDIHSSWANDLPRDVAAYDPDMQTGSTAVEFVTPGITSPGLDDELFNTGVMNANPNVRYVDMTVRGYMILDVKPERIHVDWFHYTKDEVQQRNVDPRYDLSFEVADGSPYAVTATGPAPDKADAPPLA